MDLTNPGIITHNIWGNDLVGQVKRNGGLTRYYHLKDHLGSIRVTVDAAGNAVAYDDYDPWGMLMDGRSYNAGQADNRNRFLSKEKDTETGNDWLDSRGYDSRIGRFFCVDALSELFPEHSPYSYSFNNPISFSDASGMSPDSVGGQAGFPREVAMPEVVVTATRDPDYVGGRMGWFEWVKFFADQMHPNVELHHEGNMWLWTARTYGVNIAGGRPPLVRPIIKMTQWGWAKTKIWRDLVKTVRRGGTIETLGGKIPTKEEAIKLIKEAGCDISKTRVEPPHSAQNPHNYNHINYTTPNGTRGTIRIQEL